MNVERVVLNYFSYSSAYVAHLLISFILSFRSFIQKSQISFDNSMVKIIRSYFYVIRSYYSFVHIIN